ncbi:MAG: peroxidase, partial [Silvibacterium sp.]
GKEQDPLIGNPGGGGTFTIPQRPVRRRLQGLPQFVTVRAGEYCYLPSMTALKWIAEGNDADR